MVGESFLGSVAGLGMYPSNRATAWSRAPWLSPTILLAAVTLAGLSLVALFFVEKAPNEQIFATLIALIIIVSQQKVVGEIRHVNRRLGRRLLRQG